MCMIDYIGFSASASATNENHLYETQVSNESKISDDQDPTYKVPKKRKQTPIIINPSRQSSSSSSSSSSLYSGSSSDSCDTEPCEQNIEEETSFIQETSKTPSEQGAIPVDVPIDASVITEVLSNEENTALGEEIDTNKKSPKT